MGAKAGAVPGWGVPDPEVVAKPTRRQFTAECRLRILEEAARCTDRGEVGRLLRREGALLGLGPRKRGCKLVESDPLTAVESNGWTRKVKRLERELAGTHTIVDIQGKVAGLLGFSLEDGTEC